MQNRNSSAGAKADSEQKPMYPPSSPTIGNTIVVGSQSPAAHEDVSKEEIAIVTKREYFIPELSELFIGYECELLFQSDNKLARTENYNWHKVVLDKNNFQKAHSLIKDNRIRSRFLVQQDIVNNGWIKRDNYYLEALINGLRYTIFWAKIILPDGNKTEQFRLEKRVNESIVNCVFDGRVKSINEFKKVVSWCCQ